MTDVTITIPAASVTSTTFSASSPDSVFNGFSFNLSDPHGNLVGPPIIVQQPNTAGDYVVVFPNVQFSGTYTCGIQSLDQNGSSFGGELVINQDVVSDAPLPPPLPIVPILIATHATFVVSS